MNEPADGGNVLANAVVGAINSGAPNTLGSSSSSDNGNSAAVSTALKKVIESGDHPLFAEAHRNVKAYYKSFKG